MIFWDSQASVFPVGMEVFTPSLLGSQGIRSFWLAGWLFQTSRAGISERSGDCSGCASLDSTALPRV